MEIGGQETLGLPIDVTFVVTNLSIVVHSLEEWVKIKHGYAGRWPRIQSIPNEQERRVSRVAANSGQHSYDQLFWKRILFRMITTVPHVFS